MPIYEYHCECGNEEEIILPVQERNQPQTCSVCGEVMERKISLPCSPIMKPTGRDMALDTLNSKETSFMKPEHKRLAAEGLNS